MKKNYQFIIIQKSQFNSLYALSAYHTFKSVWQKSIREISNVNFIQYSNDFTRQDYIQCIFSEGQCIALTCIRKINLQSEIDLDDSWLKVWNREYLILLSKKYSECIINSYYTVQEDYRKSTAEQGLSLSYLLGCLSALHQRELKIPVMLGMTRNDRSVNKLSRAFNCTTVDTNIIFNNTPTNLVLFKLDDLSLAIDQFPSSVITLFNNKIIDVEKEFYANVS